jgi:glycosyltransferase involved in cell wall biosynthesis
MSAPKRRVLFLIPTLTGGGSERVVVTLLQHLDRSRFDLTLAVVDTRDSVFRGEIPPDVAFIDLLCTRVRNALPRVIALVWRLRPDVVMSTLGHLNLALAITRPLLPDNTRYIARETIVVSQCIAEYEHPSWWAWAYRRFYGRFDKVICQSLDMRDDLVARFAIDPQRTVVINNPVNLQRIASALATVKRHSTCQDPSDARQSGVRLVAAGRFVRQKGFDLLIEAMALARSHRFHLTLLGDGPLRVSLMDLARSRGLGDRIEFAGFQPNPYPYLARADAFVLSSRYEGFPNVVLEALACGTPVIALPAPGGVNEILRRVEGCEIAEDISASALATVLERWKPSRISPSVVDPYSVGRIVKRYAAELLGNGDRDSPAMASLEVPPQR